MHARGGDGAGRGGAGLSLTFSPHHQQNQQRTHAPHPFVFPPHRCGQNAHGGNIQNGCGQGFDWNEAHFYFADIGEKRSIKPFEEVPPPEISRVTHQIMDGTPIKCDICQAHIQGPLAMCINCPSFNCCIRCQNKHTRGHILRLYMDSSYREGMAQAAAAETEA